MQRFFSLRFGSSNFSRKLTKSSTSSVVRLSQPHRILTTCRHCYNQTDLSTATHLRSAIRRLTDSKFLLSRRYSGSISSFSHNDRTRRSLFDWLSADKVVLGLVVANVAVFMSWQILDKKFMEKIFTISLDNVKSGRIHTMLTYAFSHIQPWHLANNMFELLFFGMTIGRVFGPKYLLKLYVAGSVGGSVFYLVDRAYMALSTKGNKDSSRSLSLGASGAVNAIVLLRIFLNPRATIYFDFIIPVPAALLGIFFIGRDLLRIIEKDSKISGWTHLGGVAVAAIAYARIRKGTALR